MITEAPTVSDRSHLHSAPHVLIVTSGGTTDYVMGLSPAAREPVTKVVHVDMDHLSRGEVWHDDVQAVAREVASLADTIPWKASLLDELKALHDHKKSTR